MNGSPDWVAAAASLPVAFAQVREDPALDFWVLDQIGRRARVALVASGGCTAAALATRTDVASMLCVDPNAAQIALARLKLHLLRVSDPAERLALLGHAGLDPGVRARKIEDMLDELDLAADALGPPADVATSGPDHCGRYERLFAALRAELADDAPSLQAVLCLSDPLEQSSRVAPETPLGRALDRAFDTILALPNLVALFGEAATRNPREPFARHFANRLRQILGTQPAAGNPFLCQMLLGRFAQGGEHFWLQSPAVETRAEVGWENSMMIPALQRHRNEFDVVHLSNILDWLGPDDARETLEASHAALRPNGWVIVRQLNSVLNIPALYDAFSWNESAGIRLLARDRSFFYRALCVGQRR